MEITFLGTSSGKTELDRFYTNLLLKESEFELLIDCGDGLSKQLINKGFSLKESLDVLIITHFHADHLGGLPTLLTQMKLLKRTKPFKLYVYDSSIKLITNLLNTFLLFTENFPFPLIIEGIRENEEIKITEHLSFIAKINSHVNSKKYITYYGEEVSPVSLSLLFTNYETKFLYTGDLGIPEDLFLFNHNNLKYLIAEAAHIEINEFVKLLENKENLKLILTHYEINKLKEFFDNSKINNFFNENRIIIAKDSFKLSD